MSFEQGLSGLNSSSKSLDVIGNNIANSSTVGFKSSTAEFADVYANSLYGTSGLSAGLGTRIANVTQQFTQGNITVTNNPLDIAINGNGFFQLANSSSASSGVTSYTRNGQFNLDVNGYLITNTGQYVCGGSGTPTPIQINTSNLTPSTSNGVTASLNLNPNATVIPATTTIDPANSTTYSYSTTATVYDSQGNSHALGFYFQNNGLQSGVPSWSVATSLDGATPAIALSGMTFDSSGVLTASPATVALGYTSPTGATLGTVALDFTGTTQQAGNSGVVAISQTGGNAGGTLANLSVDSQGNINGVYSNGDTQILGQISLATFTNPNGLVPLGNNQWAATLASGQGAPNVPGSGVAGLLQSGATEDSNIDLTNELVNMIVAQRNYQANAQTIKTQDQVLQTLVNLR